MLASGDKAVTTPVYEVFKMYMPHMGAESLRTEFTSAQLVNPLAQLTPVGGNSAAGTIPPEKHVAALSGSASRTGGGITLSVVNAHMTEPMAAEITVRGMSPRGGTMTVLQAADVHAHNSFDHPDEVRAKTTPLTLVPTSRGGFVQTFPPASVTVLVMQVG